MDTETKPNKRKTYPDRITLNGEALKRINTWIDQVTAEWPSLIIKKSDLVNWHVCQAAETLSSSAIKSLQEL
ncbi:hypothetical protein H0W26_01790, partial [Candidatus Dependentiae bacterium]|nr:hypothetical protein [Candidatus Dependentiae bacterium]